MHSRSTASSMSNNRLWLIEFLQIFLFLLGQCLSPNIDRFFQSFHAAKSNDWTCNTLVDPRQSNMAHLPPMFLRNFLHPSNNLLIHLGRPRRPRVLLLGSRASSVAKICWRSSKMPAAKWCPLEYIDELHPVTRAHTGLEFNLLESVRRPSNRKIGSSPSPPLDRASCSGSAC